KDDADVLRAAHHMNRRGSDRTHSARCFAQTRQAAISRSACTVNGDGSYRTHDFAGPNRTSPSTSRQTNDESSGPHQNAQNKGEGKHYDKTKLSPHGAQVRYLTSRQPVARAHDTQEQVLHRSMRQEPLSHWVICRRPG